MTTRHGKVSAKRRRGLQVVTLYPKIPADNTPYECTVKCNEESALIRPLIIHPQPETSISIVPAEPLVTHPHSQLSDGHSAKEPPKCHPPPTPANGLEPPGQRNGQIPSEPLAIHTRPEPSDGQLPPETFNGHVPLEPSNGPVLPEPLAIDTSPQHLDGQGSLGSSNEALAIKPAIGHALPRPEPLSIDTPPESLNGGVPLEPANGRAPVEPENGHAPPEPLAIHTPPARSNGHVPAKHWKGLTPPEPSIGYTPSKPLSRHYPPQSSSAHRRAKPLASRTPLERVPAIHSPPKLSTDPPLQPWASPPHPQQCASHLIPHISNSPIRTRPLTSRPKPQPMDSDLMTDLLANNQKIQNLISSPKSLRLGYRQKMLPFFTSQQSRPEPKPKLSNRKKSNGIKKPQRIVIHPPTKPLLSPKKLQSVLISQQQHRAILYPKSLTKRPPILNIKPNHQLSVKPRISCTRPSHLSTLGINGAVIVKVEPQAITQSNSLSMHPQQPQPTAVSTKPQGMPPQQQPHPLGFEPLLLQRIKQEPISPPVDPQQLQAITFSRKPQPMATQQQPHPSGFERLLLQRSKQEPNSPPPDSEQSQPMAISRQPQPMPPHQQPQLPDIKPQLQRLPISTATVLPSADIPMSVDSQEQTHHLSPSKYPVPMDVKPAKQVAKSGSHTRKRSSKAQVYECPICDVTFAYEVIFKLHFQACANFMPYRCHICSKGYKERRWLRSHVMNSSDRCVSCEFCGTAFTCHFHAKCGLCGVVFSAKDEKFNHVCFNIKSKSHKKLCKSPEKLYKCHICGQGFRQQKEILTHLTRQLGKDNHQCEACGSALKCEWHQKCGSCGMQFDQNFKCSEHICYRPVSKRYFNRKIQNRVASLRFRLNQRLKRDALYREATMLEEKNRELKDKVQYMKKEIARLKPLIFKQLRLQKKMNK